MGSLVCHALVLSMKHSSYNISAIYITIFIMAVSMVPGQLCNGQDLNRDHSLWTMVQVICNEQLSANEAQTNILWLSLIFI